MNDFTKEELQIIHIQLNAKINSDGLEGALKPSTFMIALRDKVESMIDNYCTHDPRETSGAIGMYHCPDCGEMQVAGFHHVRINPYE